MTSAQELTRALAGRWSGSSGSAKCPAHPDKTPSLSIRDGDGGRLLTCCHAGCSPEAVWAALRDRGLVAQAEDRPRARRPRRGPQRPDKAAPEPSTNQRSALDIWHQTRPAVGSPVKTYLLGRGITLPVPPTLRYHPGVRYERSGLLLPCMVAAVQAPDRKVTAIHRTYIRDDGKGKAGVEKSKMALGPIGNGAVRLGPAGPALGIAEGIETALSASQIFDISVWAALSVGRLQSVWLSPDVIEIQIFGDNGERGHEGAEKARKTFNEQGRRVVLRFPPAGFGDWNDFLKDQKTEAIT